MPWYNVEILLKDGRSLTSPTIPERQEAEEEVSAIAEEMNSEDAVVKRSWAAVSEGAHIAAVQLHEHTSYNPALNR